jgi:predicted acylesterase/phospholipase RssA
MALEEHKIPVHFIAGTSSGALAGGLFAAGVSATRLHALVGGLKWSTISTVSLPMLHLSSLSHSPLSLPLNGDHERGAAGASLARQLHRAWHLYPLQA